MDKPTKKQYINNEKTLKYTPLVSIVIISFNHAKFIESCIKSVELQDYENIELFIYDNNSQDLSIDIINKAIANLNFKIETIFNSENIGLPRVLNDSISRANGEYIIFIAADDYMAFK